MALLAVSAAASAAPIRVAVLPVVVHTASEESAYLSKGLAQMLSSRLEQAGGIEVEVISDDSTATTDASSAVATGESAGAEFVIFGSFTQFGEGASLDVRCARVAGVDPTDGPESRQVFIQSGRLGEIIPRLDDLASRIVHYVKGGGAATGNGDAAPAASQGTQDLERRVEALEHAVFFEKSAKKPAAEAPSEKE